MLQPKRHGSTNTLGAWPFLLQRLSYKNSTLHKPTLGQHLTQDKKPISEKHLRQHEAPIFRKHLVQPHLDQRTKGEPRERSKERFRVYWRKRKEEPRKPALPPARLKFSGVLVPPSQVPKQDGSLTQEWLSHFKFDGTVIPKRFSWFDFPGDDETCGKHLSQIEADEVKDTLRTGYLSPRGPSRKRTQEDKRRVEVVLTTPIPPLAEYVSPDMMDMIRKSPLIDRNENIVVFRSHRHSTRGQNLLECYRTLSRFVRNIASEIVYREQRNAADESMYRAEGGIDDPEYAIRTC